MPPNEFELKDTRLIGWSRPSLKDSGDDLQKNSSGLLKIVREWDGFVFLFATFAC